MGGGPAFAFAFVVVCSPTSHLNLSSFALSEVEWAEDLLLHLLLAVVVAFLCHPPHSNQHQAPSAMAK
jgi:hypothetical protein